MGSLDGSEYVALLRELSEIGSHEHVDTPSIGKKGARPLSRDLTPLRYSNAASQPASRGLCLGWKAKPDRLYRQLTEGAMCHATFLISLGTRVTHAAICLLASFCFAVVCGDQSAGKSSLIQVLHDWMHFFLFLLA